MNGNKDFPFGAQIVEIPTRRESESTDNPWMSLTKEKKINGICACSFYNQIYLYLAGFI